MSKYYTTDTELTSIANAIRSKGGTSEQLVYPNGFVTAINAITGSGGSDAFSIVDTTDTNGGTIRTIIAGINLANDTVTAAHLENGYIAHDSSGNEIIGTLSAGTTPTLQAKTNISPTESSQTIQPDSGYDGLSSVQINAISSTYVGSGITSRFSSDLTASGATVTAPAGYYANDASASVASMTLPTSAASSATSGYSSKATISRSTSDQYINIPTGYNSAGGYYKVSAVANGSATGPTSLSGSSATVSTGTNTITLTKTGVTTTPTVSAGYVSSATASTATVALTASVTTKAATTYHPSTSDQTIASGSYTTGTQTIKAVTIDGLEAGNIKTGVTVKIGDSTDDDCVISVTGTYSGGGTAMNVQTSQVTTRRNNTALGSINSLTCSTAGTYDVYWTCTRSNTSQTWGSQLYIGDSAYGTENTTWSNHVQNNHLTGVTIAKNATVAVYGRSRSGYYIYAPQLTIVQTA